MGLQSMGSQRVGHDLAIKLPPTPSFDQPQPPPPPPLLKQTRKAPSLQRGRLQAAETAPEGAEARGAQQDRSNVLTL